jgi:hypothetical protein
MSKDTYKLLILILSMTVGLTSFGIGLTNCLHLPAWKVIIYSFFVPTGLVFFNVWIDKYFN